MRRNITIAVGVCMAILLIVAVFSVTKNSTSSSSALPFTRINEPTPTPTPYPFQEMTIPALRARSYQSSLSEQQLLSERPAYNAYLTSYLSDGLKVNGLLTVPTEAHVGGGGYPAIIFVHGYIPPAQYNTQTQYASYVDYFARNGFVVFKIDLRGHGSSEGEPGGGYYSADYIVDVLNAYAALQNDSRINPKKIGLWGHSMAGNVVFRSLAAKPDIPAVVIWAGAVYTYTDQQKYGINDSSYQPPGTASERARRRQRIRDLYGEPDSQNVFWQQVIPTNYISDIQGALSIYHAVDDAVVDIGYSRDLMSVLANSTFPHELHEYPSGGHNLTGSSFVQAMDNSVDFFRKYLQ